MKHNQYNPDFQFVCEPVEFTMHTEKELLQYCLGGVLYMPATKNIIEKILAGHPPAPSMVMCFEDAIREEDLHTAEANVLDHLDRLFSAKKAGDILLGDIPLIFLRVRNPEQFRSFSSRLSSDRASVLTGFVFPKFDSSNGAAYFNCLDSTCLALGSLLYGMPILEGVTIALRESRMKELSQIKDMLAEHRDTVLNVRVGATDFSSIFGVRRGINYSIYDIMTIRDCLSDILNYLTREGEEYVISAPVWEYFLADKKENIEHLLEHNIHRSLLQRSPIINEAIDGLLREVILDKANGFIGKTIIHPSHLRFVNGMQAVTREEYEDALQILDTSGGVIKSASANKMNEINPHRSWAKKIICRATAYGVIEDESDYLRLILGGK